MHKIGFVMCATLLLVFSCKSHDKKAAASENSLDFESLSGMFRKASLPFLLTDTALLKNRDTTIIRNAEFVQLVPDSVKKQVFASTKVKFTPLYKVSAKGKETYLLVKGVAGKKTAALLLAFDAKGNYATTLPFLVPDADASTEQNSTIEETFTVTKNIVRKNKGQIAADGKEVYAYFDNGRQFNLIMIDLLDDQKAELINPIDTLPATRKFAGDYVQGKRNLVSVRNGRTPNQATVFVHLEKNDGECTGELKGDILFTSSTTAIYRQGGDPCVLQFIFSGASVTLKEEQGCGNHRGLNCTLEGRYTKKKTAKTKVSSKNQAKK